jgi:S1-C subfamily serine protease
VQGFLSESGFPSVFSQLEPPPVPASRPTTRYARQVAATAMGSTVKVLGQACGFEQEGSAFVVEPGTVVTNAHVVAGEDQTDVVVGNRTYAATVVLFDPTFDIAVLHTTAPLGPPLTIDPTMVTPGTKGAVVGYPEDGPLTVGAASVAAQINAQGRNIYNEGTISREVYEVDADIEPGNSGGPLIGPDGDVIGVVFSRSTAYKGIGYALASPGVLSHVDQAAGRTKPAGTGACVED